MDAKGRNAGHKMTHIMVYFERTSLLKVTSNVIILLPINDIYVIFTFQDSDLLHYIPFSEPVTIKAVKSIARGY